MAAVTPGMTANQTAQGEITAGRRAMLLQGLDGVKRASGLKTTGRPQAWTEQQAVGLDQTDQHLSGPLKNTAQHDWRAVENKARSCCLTASLSAKDDPEENCLAAKPWRKRTT